MKVTTVRYQIFCDASDPQAHCHDCVEYRRGEANVMNLTDARLAAERAGWSTGKTDLCPVCKARRAER